MCLVRVEIAIFLTARRNKMELLSYVYTLTYNFLVDQGTEYHFAF